MELRYLWAVKYADGTHFAQTGDDKSVTAEGKSAWFDVKKDQVQILVLFNDKHRYLVDLTDGHFEVDGVPIWNGQNPAPVNVAKLEPVFFRQHTHEFTPGKADVHLVRYCIGWRCTVDGREHKEIIGTF
jgi:hypothetical protein